MWMGIDFLFPLLSVLPQGLYTLPLNFSFDRLTYVLPQSSPWSTASFGPEDQKIISQMGV